MHQRRDKLGKLVEVSGRLFYFQLTIGVDNSVVFDRNLEHI